MIKDTDFAKVMEALLSGVSPKKMAVAVSGGADSLCLTLLADIWARQNGVALTALTVDHGLRAESAAEAATVHQWLQEKGICHETLTWKGDKPQTRIEERARQARYHLLCAWCKAHGVNQLLVAHHQGDQSETFLLRLARSSGVEGLSAIRPVAMREGICVLRPFLDFSRAEIQQTLQARFGQSWIEDPSNQSPQYERVRLRQFQPQLDKIGLTEAAIALSAKRLNRASFALNQWTETFIKENVEHSPSGYAYTPWQPFNALPDEIKLRTLSSLFEWVGGDKKLPRLSQLEDLLASFPCRATLNEAQVVCVKRGFYICPEYAKMPPAMMLEPNKPFCWGRFYGVCNQACQIKSAGDSLKIKSLPALVRRTIPAFFDKKGLAFAPTIDYKRDKTDIIGTIQLKDK